MAMPTKKRLLIIILVDFSSDCLSHLAECDVAARGEAARHEPQGQRLGGWAVGWLHVAEPGVQPEAEALIEGDAPRGDVVDCGFHFEHYGEPTEHALQMLDKRFAKSLRAQLGLGGEVLNIDERAEVPIGDEACKLRAAVRLSLGDGDAQNAEPAFGLGYLAQLAHGATFVGRKAGLVEAAHGLEMGMLRCDGLELNMHGGGLGFELIKRKMALCSEKKMLNMFF